MDSAQLKKRTEGLPKAMIMERIDITYDLMVMKIKPEIPFPFKPGQYCTIGIEGVERPYSINSSPDEEYLELFLELVPGGEQTPKLWQTQVGDVLTIRPRAHGSFTFDDTFSNHFMVATVTGIAPLMSIIRNYSGEGLRSHTFYVLQGASYQDELAHKEELEKLSKTYEIITYIPTVSRPDEKRNEGWQGEKGRVNLIAEKYIEKFSLGPKDTLVYTCGHPEMIKDVKQRLGTRGYQIKEEKYW